MRYTLFVHKSGQVSSTQDHPGVAAIAVDIEGDPIVETRTIDQGEYENLLEKTQHYSVKFDHNKRRLTFEEKSHAKSV